MIVKLFLLILSTVLLPHLLPGQITANAEVVLSGTYQGKNLYIQNPLKIDKSSFCTIGVFVNDEPIIKNPQTSAFEIKLTPYSVGQSVEVKIVHHNGCKPKFINPQVIRETHQFKFISVVADATSIRWHTQGEQVSGYFIIERNINNEWLPVHEIEGSKNKEYNQYEIIPDYHMGKNDFRIRYTTSSGDLFFSKLFSYTSNQPKTLITTTMNSDKIVLSQYMPYEVLDSSGNTVHKGEGVEIALNDLEKGIYYLNIGDKVEKFAIK